MNSFQGGEKMAAEINFIVGGEAGQGVQTVGFALAKTASHAGLYVFADQDRPGCQRDGQIHQNSEAIGRIQRFDRILHG
jgi:hypothetical protein